MKIGRTIRVGLMVGLLFFGWYMRDFLYQGQNPKGWHFKLFSADHWAYVWNEFKSGWIINATSDWIFILSILLMFPIFILIWWGACKISWRKSIKTIYYRIKSFLFRPDPKKVVKKKIAVKAKGSHKKVRPLPMASAGRPALKQSGKTMDANIAQPTKTIPSKNQESEELSPVDLDEEVANMPLEDIQLPEKIRLEEDLIALLSAANYQILKDVTLGNLPLTYMGISEDKIVLCLTDTEKGDWLADEEFFNGEEPLWFSESAHRISPVYQLSQVMKTFSQKLEAASVSQVIIPILIEKDGNIINASDMQETWKKLGITVCRTDLGGPEELPSFSNALPQATAKGTEETLNQIRDIL